MDELRSYIVSLLKEGKRVDGRGLTDYREPVVVKYHVSETAEGSAEVRIGDTIVMAGVKLSIETPYPDTPDQGGIMVNVELYPMSSPDYEPGPPGIAAVELARVVDRGIRESKAIDLSKLCIEKGAKAWTFKVCTPCFLAFFNAEFAQIDCFTFTNATIDNACKFNCCNARRSWLIVRASHRIQLNIHHDAA